MCPQDQTEPQDLIRCALWRLTGFMVPTDGDLGTRTTGLIQLAPNRWASAVASIRHSETAWADRVKIRVFQSSSPEALPVEEIVDSGLDGLWPETPEDAYLRFQNGDQPANLLLGLDPALKPAINEEYLALLDELLRVLKKDAPVHGPIQWSTVVPGVEQARIEALQGIRLGDNQLDLLRIDPCGFDLVPFSAKEPGCSPPVNIEGWARRLPEAVALFNAGQYYPDQTYIGLFFKDGVDLGSGLHPKWKALLASGGPVRLPPYPPTHLLDLEKDTFDPENNLYRYVIQSFMLLDQRGLPRVRQTDYVASRTVVAQDDQGRGLVVLVKGGCTLYELALWLAGSDLGIKRAMSLDGGFESQLLIRKDSKTEVVYGEGVISARGRHYYPGGLKVPLPAVIAVLPRTR